MQNYEAILTDWALLNNKLSSFTIEDLRALINYEVSTKGRASFLTRLHQRYSKLVTTAERDAILKGGLL